MNENAYKLLAILQSHAPDGPAQERAAEVYRRAEASGVNVELVMASALIDGLRYGNWPWAI